jgi:squalene-hopene/tetraprenyl-beta-curcumene cyclase
MRRGIKYLKREQEASGSWFGRWGTNYIYGTWSVLSAINIAGEDITTPDIKQAVDWLIGQQREDGGWGEDCASYWPTPDEEQDHTDFALSLPSQTAWAILGLMAAGEGKSDAVAKGAQFLIETCQEDGDWVEEHFNAVGFPRVFYLRYHGYRQYFPLLALARYRNLASTDLNHPIFGL